MNSAFAALVSGRVQLVMYRDFAARKARGLGIVGTVQNLKDGTVRVVAEGERGALEQLLAHLRHGPLLAEVRDVAVQWAEPHGEYVSFSITY